MPTATLHAVQARSTEPSPIDPSALLHEAARYAVLRRMGSAIRHQIAGALQPVSMLSSLLERRVQAEAPDLESLRKNCAEMSGLTRSASSECVALVGWLVPREGELVAVGEGIENCLHLLAAEMSFRGFSFVNAAKDQQALVASAALRAVLPASLMVLTDAAQQAAQVQITAKAADGAVTLSLVMTPAGSGEASGQAVAYRALTWQDVQALSAEEGVELRIMENGVDLVLAQRERVPPGDADVRWG